MPNKGDAMPSTDSTEAQTRRNWWQRAKRFIISKSPMYDVGGNAKLRISDYRIKANVVFIANHSDHSTSGTSHVNQGEAQETDQQSPLPNINISTPRDGIGSRDEDPWDDQPQTSVEANSNISVSPLDPNNAFESEAISVYTNPAVPSNSSEAYASTTGRSHIYSLEMLIHKAGYPLYIPTPSRGLPAAYLRKGVRIGDVGLVTANGAFDFLFNTCQHDDPSDAGVNPSILPDGFELLRPIIRVNGGFDPDICLTSHHVNEIRDHSSSSAFQCSAKGAVLALPTGATVYEAMNVRHFQAHAARHAARWYKYALNEGGRDISNGSLYLVTECTKSMNWGISVFYANPTANNDHRLIFDRGSCQWELDRGKVVASVGPKPTDIILSDDGEPNQCVFLRGFKIMLRPDIWDELNGAIDVRCQDGESSYTAFTSTIIRSSSHQTSGGQTDSFRQNASGSRNASGPSQNVRLNAIMPLQTQGPWLGNVILEEVLRETAPLHPSDPINVMLLHLKPEASVALVHDSVWCDQLPSDFMEDPLNPNIDGLLENVKRSYKAMVDEYESVVLISIELDSKSQYDFDASHPIIACLDGRDIFMDDTTEPSLSSFDVTWEAPSDWRSEDIESSDGDTLISGGVPSEWGATSYMDRLIVETEEPYESNPAPLHGVPSEWGATSHMDSLMGTNEPYESNPPSLHLIEAGENRVSSFSTPSAPHDIISPMRSIHKATSKRRTRLTHTCPSCAEQFTSQHSLQYHMNVHFDLQPYKCKYAYLGCPFGAAGPMAVRRHSGTCRFKPHNTGDIYVPGLQGVLPGAPGNQEDKNRLLDLDPSDREQSYPGASVLGKSFRRTKRSVLQGLSSPLDLPDLPTSDQDIWPDILDSPYDIMTSRDREREPEIDSHQGDVSGQSLEGNRPQSETSRDFEF